MRLIYATHLRSLSRSHVQPAVALSGGYAIAAKPLKCTIEGKRHNAFFQPTRSASLMKIAMAIASAAGLASCATTPEASPAVLSELAPGGTLRAAIHFGNPTLAVRDPVSGAPRGVSVDLSRELGRPRRFGRACHLRRSGQGGASAAVQGGGYRLRGDRSCACDRRRLLRAYLVIEGAYFVQRGSPIHSNSEVDRPGVRVAVAPPTAL